jgi:DNA-binding winged helix-turn-helix (wHTH) protein
MLRSSLPVGSEDLVGGGGGSVVDKSEKIEILQERVRQLEEMLGLGADAVKDCSSAFNLTPREAQVMSILVERGKASTENLLAAVWTGPDGVYGSMMGVIVHRIRKKILPLGIAISTHSGWGYELEPAMQRAAKARLAAWRAEGSPVRVMGYWRHGHVMTDNEQILRHSRRHSRKSAGEGSGFQDHRRG